jgi:hypothetical protein
MSKGQRKSPEIDYNLKAKLQKLEEKKAALELQFDAEPHVGLVRELSLVNYHIECVTNRINHTFIDPLGDCEYALQTSGLTYTGTHQ